VCVPFHLNEDEWSEWRILCAQRHLLECYGWFRLSIIIHLLHKFTLNIKMRENDLKEKKNSLYSMIDSYWRKCDEYVSLDGSIYVHSLKYWVYCRLCLQGKETYMFGKDLWKCYSCIFFIIFLWGDSLKD